MGKGVWGAGVPALILVVSSALAAVPGTADSATGTRFAFGPPPALPVTAAISLAQTPPAPQDESAAPEQKKPAPESEAAESPPPPKKSTKKKRAPLIKVFGSFGLEAIYDDNVFRFSPENLYDFRSGQKPEKFKLDTYDDFILSPSLTLDFERPVFGKNSTGFRVKYTLYQYFSNPEKTNSSWWLRLRQPTWGRDAVEFHYFHSPWYYIREMSDRPPFSSMAQPLQWIAFDGTRNAFRLAYSKRISRTFWGRLEGERVMRFYNKPFMENDNWEWNISGILFTTLSRRWRLTTEYTYSNTKARGYDAVGETLETSDDGDGSYERDYYRVGLRYRPRRSVWIFRDAEVTGKYMIYYFTSEKPYYEDSTHRGREDKNWSAEIELGTEKIWGPVSMGIGYRFSKRSSTSTSTQVGADSIEEDKNYEYNRYWIGAIYPF